MTIHRGDIDPSSALQAATRRFLSDRHLARLGSGDRRAALHAAAHRLFWCGSLSVCGSPVTVTRRGSRIEEFTAATNGEGRYRPLVQRLAAEAVSAIEEGGIQVADDYELPEDDRRALAARPAEAGYLDRMRATYAGGVDGWIDYGIAFTQPWGFELTRLVVPVGVWYGRQDVLGPQTHPEHLLAVITAAERQELPGGPVLTDPDLDAIYTWLSTIS